jgi:flavin reductase (DIM6/NTAB) family NADH-FMN oxidoreductase RutF
MVPRLSLITDPTTEPASPRLFAEAMSALASGVAVVTCEVDGRPWGMTVTAFASVSADPPTVLVSIDSDAPAARAIGESGLFGVSILAADQLDIARHGSAPGKPKFLDAFVEPGPGGGASPMVAGVLAHLDCEVERELRVADHTVFFGLARAARASRAGLPLVYHRRAYRTLAAHDIRRPPIESRTTCLTS